MNIKEEILYKAMKDEYNGLGMADQCDQSIDRELYRSLKVVMNWIDTPSFSERMYYTKKQ